MADTTTSSTPTLAAPLVELNGGQVAVVLDPVALAKLGLAAPAPAAPQNEDGLFERSLKQKPRKDRTKAEYRRAWKEFKAYLAEQCDGRTPLQTTDEDVQDFFEYL